MAEEGVLTEGLGTSGPSEPAESLVEAKLSVMHRLIKLGVWSEAKEFRDGKIALLRAGGMRRGEAVREVYRLLGERYPMGAKERGKALEAASFRSTKFPWDDLPEAVDPRVESRWVAANLDLVVDKKGERVVLRWRRAKGPPPSWSARRLMEHAAVSPKGYMERVWMKFAMEVQGGDDEQVRRERKSVEEIRAVLERVKEFETT